MLKGPAHFESITHVPFIWAEPGVRPARTTDVLGGTLDIAATILDRVRIQPYNGIQGESLLPAISGEGAMSARDSMVIEDDQQRATLGFQVAPRLRTLVTRRWRMTIAHADPWGELYDLENDPNEMDNLFEDAAHRGVRAELMEKLAYREMELADRSPLPMGRA
jgi:arylsulfatase A-like enzyme